MSDDRSHESAAAAAPPVAETRWWDPDEQSDADGPTDTNLLRELNRRLVDDMDDDFNRQMYAAAPDHLADRVTVASRAISEAFTTDPLIQGANNLTPAIFRRAARAAVAALERAAAHGPECDEQDQAPPRCVAHGEASCALCSRNPSTCAQHDHPNQGCSTYEATGMHWDTCPNRIIGPLEGPWRTPSGRPWTPPADDGPLDIPALWAAAKRAAEDRADLAVVPADELAELLGEYRALQRILDGSDRKPIGYVVFGTDEVETERGGFVELYDSVAEAEEHAADMQAEEDQAGGGIVYRVYAVTPVRPIDALTRGDITINEWRRRNGFPEAAPQEPPKPLIDPDEPPTARVTRVGRWRYRIEINHGGLAYGPDGYGWHRLGHGRAMRKANRELARYLRREEREANAITIKPHGVSR